MKLRYHAGRLHRKFVALPALGALAVTPVLVHTGDTMSGIAASHGVSLSSLEAANPQIANPNLIYTGQSLNLPGVSSSTQTSHRSYSSSGYSRHSSPSSPASSYTSSSSIPGWAKCIVFRESSNNPRAVNSIPGYIGNGGGLFGDLTSTWNNYGGYHQPFQAPVSVQIQFNEQLHNQLGLKPWAADGCPGT